MAVWGWCWLRAICVLGVLNFHTSRIALCGVPGLVFHILSFKSSTKGTQELPEWRPSTSGGLVSAPISNNLSSVPGNAVCFASCPTQLLELPSCPCARFHLDFSGTNWGKEFTFRNRCLFKVDWSCRHPTNLFCLRHQSNVNPLLSVWGFRDDGHGQWWFRQFRIWTVSGEQYGSNTWPYHPASNGLSERAFQIVKKGLKETDGTVFQVVQDPVQLARNLLPAFRLLSWCWATGLIHVQIYWG